MSKIKTALISVSDKKNLKPLLNILRKNKVKIISSGGTYKEIIKLKFQCLEVSEFTNSPEVLEGRVKTLHPKIYGGILNRDTPNDYAEMIKHCIWPIDIVVVNLYPFKKVISKNHSVDDAIENIDIGGVSLIRAAFKNYKSKLIFTNPSQYLFAQMNWNKIDINFKALDSVKNYFIY